MSTRRARIKAVAALPPRRKNVNADAKTKQNVPKEGYEKGPSTPKTPRADTGKKDETKSPIPKTDIKSPLENPVVRTPPPLVPISITKIQVENEPSPRPVLPKEPVLTNTTPQIEKEESDSPQSEKVSVITSAPNSNEVVINNPSTKNTPEKQPFPKLVSTPEVINIDCQNRNDVEKTITTDCEIQNIQKSNIQNVQANHVPKAPGIEGKKKEVLGNENEADKILGTPPDFDKDKRNDIPDGK